MSVFAQYLGVILLHDAQALEGEHYSGSFASLATRLTNRLMGLEISPSDIKQSIEILSEFGGSKEYKDPLTGGYYQINYDNFRYYFIQESPDFTDEDKEGYRKLRQFVIDSFPIFVTYAENGKAFAEDVINHLKEAMPDQIATLKSGNDTAMSPASDRMVPLNHNSPEYQEISEKLDELYEEARASNKFGDTAEERNRLVESLDAARKLWAMHEIKFMQLQVGVVMAVEDAGRALQSIGKTTGWSLLTDLIKKFVKDTIGIDF
jgi:hypothetical protein